MRQTSVKTSTHASSSTRKSTPISKIQPQSTIATPTTDSTVESPNSISSSTFELITLTHTQTQILIITDDERTATRTSMTVLKYTLTPSFDTRTSSLITDNIFESAIAPTTTVAASSVAMVSNNQPTSGQKTIVGSVVGSVAGVTLIILCFLVFLTQKKKRKSRFNDSIKREMELNDGLQYMGEIGYGNQTAGGEMSQINYANQDVSPMSGHHAPDLMLTGQPENEKTMGYGKNGVSQFFTKLWPFRIGSESTDVGAPSKGSEDIVNKAAESGAYMRVAGTANDANTVEASRAGLYRSSRVFENQASLDQVSLQDRNSMPSYSGMSTLPPGSRDSSQSQKPILGSDNFDSSQKFSKELDESDGEEASAGLLHRFYHHGNESPKPRHYSSFSGSSGAAVIVGVTSPQFEDDDYGKKPSGRAHRQNAADGFKFPDPHEDENENEDLGELGSLGYELNTYMDVGAQSSDEEEIPRRTYNGLSRNVSFRSSSTAPANSSQKSSSVRDMAQFNANQHSPSLSENTQGNGSNHPNGSSISESL